MGIIGDFFGHKFEAVYDEETKFVGNQEIINAISDAAYIGDVPSAIQKLNDSKRMYVQHVCIRCGKTVKKDQT